MSEKIEYTEGKIKELERDIADWKKSLELLDGAPDVKKGLTVEYSNLEKKIKEWETLRNGLMAILAELKK